MNCGWEHAGQALHITLWLAQTPRLRINVSLVGITITPISEPLVCVRPCTKH